MLILELENPLHFPILKQLLEQYKPSLNPEQDGYVHIEPGTQINVNINENEYTFIMASMLRQIPDRHVAEVIYAVLEPEIDGKGTFGAVSNVKGFIYFNENGVRFDKPSDLVVKSSENSKYYHSLEGILKSEHQLVEAMDELKSELPLVHDQKHHLYLLFMKQIQGMTLFDFVHQNMHAPYISAGRMLKISISACDALIKFHSRFTTPLFHRDIKLDNIMITLDDAVQFIDLGKAVFEDQLKNYTTFGAYRYTDPRLIHQTVRQLSTPHWKPIYYTQFTAESDAFSLYIVLMHLFGINLHKDGHEMDLRLVDHLNKHIQVPDISRKTKGLNVDERQKLKELFQQNMNFDIRNRASLQQTRDRLYDIYNRYICRNILDIDTLSPSSVQSLSEKVLFDFLSSELSDFFCHRFSKHLSALAPKIEKFVHLLPVHTLDKLENHNFAFNTLDLRAILKLTPFKITEIKHLIQLGVPVSVEACEDWIQSYPHIEGEKKTNWLLMLRYLYDNCKPAKEKLYHDFTSQLIQDSFIKYLARWYVLVPSLSAHEFHFIYMKLIGQCYERAQLSNQFNQMIQQPDFKIDVTRFKSWFDGLKHITEDQLLLNQAPVAFLNIFYDFLNALNSWITYKENNELIKGAFSNEIAILITKSQELLEKNEAMGLDELTQLLEALRLTLEYQTELDALFKKIKSAHKLMIDFSDANLSVLSNQITIDENLMVLVKCASENLETALECYDIYESLHESNLLLSQRLEPEMIAFMSGLANQLSSEQFSESYPFVSMMFNIKEFILLLNEDSPLAPYISMRVANILDECDDIMMPLAYLWEDLASLHDYELGVITIQEYGFTQLFIDASKRAYSALLMSKKCTDLALKHISDIDAIKSIDLALRYIKKYVECLPINKQLSLGESITNHIKAYFEGELSIDDVYNLLTRVEQRLISHRFLLENPTMEHAFFRSNHFVRSQSNNSLSKFVL